MKRILLVEDDPQVRGMLTKMLQKAGYDVRSAANGEEAAEVLQGGPVDAIVTDIFMPQKDGLETISYMQQNHPGVKIIAISGGARGGSFNFLPVAESMGADAVLKKPFSQETLLETLKKVFADD